VVDENGTVPFGATIRGNSMIAPTVVTEVRRLLDEKSLSQRKISQLTGVSRGSVRAIASGKRPDYETLRQPADDWEEPTGPATRCPDCGGTVYMPCQLCRVRKAIASSPRPRSQHPAMQNSEFLELNLRPEHRARYEEIRHRAETPAG
jgi:transcriptional regulator with XRE-family HTH domain